MYRYSRGRGRTSDVGRRKYHFPALLAPTPATEVVNIYQIFGQIPRTFNTVLAIQPKLNDLLDIYGPNPQPIKVSTNYPSQPKSRT